MWMPSWLQLLGSLCFDANKCHHLWYLLSWLVWFDVRLMVIATLSTTYDHLVRCSLWHGRCHCYVRCIVACLRSHTSQFAVHNPWGKESNTCFISNYKKTAWSWRNEAYHMAPTRMSECEIMSCCSQSLKHRWFLQAIITSLSEREVEPLVCPMSVCLRTFEMWNHNF